MTDVFRSTEQVAMPWGTMAYGRRQGNGPTLVLLHGGGCDPTDWQGVAERLPHDWDLVWMDFRGHGRSSVPPAFFVLDDLADDVIALVERLKVAPAVLAGHSLGGMVGKRITAKRADVVRGLVMVEGWTNLTAARHLQQTMYGDLPAEVAQAIRHRAERTFTAWPKGMHPAFWESLKTYDASDVMQHTDLPVLELYGDRGLPRPSRAALGVPDRPNIRVVWLPGAGHYLLHERADEIAAETVSWMESV